MTATISTAPLTPEDLLKMPDEGSAFELVDGILVERHMGAESSEIAIRISVLISLFLANKPLARVFGPDTGYQCFPDDRSKVRRPDVSVVRRDRLPNGKAPAGYVMVPPDLAVEVISPNDTAAELEEKIAEYLAAGFPLIWVVSPSTRTVRIHRLEFAKKGPVSMLKEHDTIDGEDILPGFSCVVREFFV